MKMTSRLGTFLLTLSGALALCEGVASAQGTLTYYFAHIASAGIWRTTFTYVNQATVPVSCSTSFYSDAGGALLLPFNGNSISSTSDTIGPGALVRRQTDVQPGLPVTTGWAVANCSGPIKASALFRAYNGTTALAEASVPAMLFPASQFVTYADQTTGVAYANPSLTTATLTFTAKDGTGAVIGTQSISLPARAHGSQNLGPLFGIPTFQGSVTITSSVPIVSLSLNAEAAPIISSLPPGEVIGTTPAGPTAYYFPHIAAAGAWRTTFTYVNASAQAVTCTTSFYGDSGSPLTLSFGGAAVNGTTDIIPAGGIARRQTDNQPNLPVTTGWASASCTGPVKASALFREFNGNVPQGEASVIAMTAPTSQFLTYADRNTGVAYANPSPNPATITLAAQDGSGTVIGTGSVTLAPMAHGSANLGPLLGIPNFTGSVMVTSLQPIVSLSLNAEAYPSFSSLPPGDGGSFQVYGVWDCGNDSCNWATVRNMFDFDTRNHWMIDRGDGTGLPSVNLVVLSFVQPTKLLNLTNDAQTVNGIPIGMNAAIVKYFTSHNVRVMLSLGGSTYVSDWDQALSTNSAQLGINAANAAKSLGVGFEIDYENDTNPNLPALQAFITAYRSVLPYDPTGTNPAARLTIDLAAGDAFLTALAQTATSTWLTGSNQVLDFANATVPNGLAATSDAETNWQQHVNGRTNAGSTVPPLPPAKFTGAMRLDLAGAVEPECNMFNFSLENNTGVFAQTLAPNGAGSTTGMLGYMFWGAETPVPSTCEGGVGSGAKGYNIPIPIPPLRQQ